MGDEDCGGSRIVYDSFLSRQPLQQTNLKLNALFLASSFAAHLHTGELVAVKVQRPGMSHLLTLDAMLFHMIGGQLKRFAKARKDLLVAVNEMVRVLNLIWDLMLFGSL